MSKPLNNDKVIIRFIGIGSTIFKYSVNQSLLARMENAAKVLGLPIEVAIFDIEFFTLLKDEELSCLYDLKKEYCIDGLIFGYNFQIEISLNGKRKRTIKQFDLINPYTLFPQYNIKTYESKFISNSSNLISIVESYTGQIKCFEFSVEKFDLEKLFFVLNEVTISEGNNQIIISGIKYDNRTQKNKGDDNLIIQRLALIE